MAVQVVGELLAVQIETVQGRDGKPDWTARRAMVFGGSAVHTVLINERFPLNEFMTLRDNAEQRPQVVLAVQVTQKGALYLDKIISAEVTD